MHGFKEHRGFFSLRALSEGMGPVGNSLCAYLFQVFYNLVKGFFEVLIRYRKSQVLVNCTVIE